jgi:hypothetical protein
MSNIAEQAEAALGKPAKGDRQLRPEIHAQSLPAEAAALKTVLTAPGLQDLIAQYRHFSDLAADYQKAYKWKAWTSAIATFLAIVFGCGLILEVSEAAPQIVIQTATVIQAVLVVTSFLFALYVAFTKPFDLWMQMRGEAENARLALFNKVLEAREAPGGAKANELPLLPLQLEYLRRYLLDIERNYYKLRGAEHLKASRTARNWRIAAFVVVILAMIFPVAWALQGKEWIPAFLQAIAVKLPTRTIPAEHILLAVTVIASGLQGMLSSFAFISLDDRNAARYIATSANLEDLADNPLKEARAGAAAGDRSAVLKFSALLQQEISAEHREWIALRKVVPNLSLQQLATERLPKLQ